MAKSADEKKCKGCGQPFTRRPSARFQLYCDTCRPVRPAGAVRGRKGHGDLAAVMRQYVHRLVAEEVAAQAPAAATAAAADLLRQVFTEVAGR